jgi:hypothetical protein
MKLYTCEQCNNLLYFENSVCLRCNHTVGFDPYKMAMVTLVTGKDQHIWQDAVLGTRYRQCANVQHATCNWLIPETETSDFCLACALNRTIPQLSESNIALWKRIEVAKHRLIYSLLRLGLPLVPGTDGASGLAFDFLADTDPQTRVVTGHLNGIITLNIEEANEAERVKNKLDLGEKYRTLLGHFRHEIGHYYWDVMLRDGTLQKPDVQLVFGNDDIPYDEALKAYYAQGAAADWSNNYISPYATSHPWEDFAETWSHYLHLMDTLETAYYFGLGVHPKKTTGSTAIDAQIDRDPYTIKSFEEIFFMWLPLTFAVNSLNRSMGHNDFYPFIVPPAVVKKLSFVHAACEKYRALS